MYGCVRVYTCSYVHSCLLPVLYIYIVAHSPFTVTHGVMLQCLSRLRCRCYTTLLLHCGIATVRRLCHCYATLTLLCGCATVVLYCHLGSIAAVVLLSLCCAASPLLCCFPSVVLLCRYRAAFHLHISCCFATVMLFGC